MDIDTNFDSSGCSSTKRKHFEIETGKNPKTNKKIKKPKLQSKGGNKDNCSKTGTSELIKYCYKNKLDLPCYKIYETTDYSNNKLFNVQCNIRNLVGYGVGNKKKEGKHNASNLLLAKLKQKAKYLSPIDIGNLEEGEICDLEEGEITDEPNNNFITQVDKELIEKETLPLEYKKYKSSKVYMEGNVCKNNMIVSDFQNSAKTNVEKLVDFCFEHQLPSARYEIEEHSGFRVSIFTCKCSVLQLTVKTTGASRSAVKEKASKFLQEKMIKLVHLLKPNDNDNKNNKFKVFDLEEGEIVDDLNDNENSWKGKRFQNNDQQSKYKYNKEQKLNYLQTKFSMSALYNYCLEHNIPSPTYIMVNKRNLAPNKPLFAFKCYVLRLSKVGVGTTKREAQHRAAKLVYLELLNQNKDGVNQVDVESDLEEGELTLQDEVQQKEYTKMKLQNHFISYKQKGDLLLQSITDRQNIIKTNKPYTSSILIKSFKDIDDRILRNHALIILEYLCKELDCTYDLYDINSSNGCIVTVFLNTTPSWSFIGEGQCKIKAQQDAIFKLIKFLTLMNM